ncbi:putative cysteamine dioxygenase [Lupinus albus]|uniref:cysteine dioxygenase n=1 Tax=Lupinus albus TaxID=3870 RepID=A0A6A4NHX4_LUPAL|nr:putative cysteamine dioxygenase [Lupinus albus]
MGIERSLSDRKGKNFCELPEEKITNSKSRKKNRRRHKKVAASPVQKLFDTCKDVFVSDGVGIVPPPQHIQSLQSVLDGIKPEDVGLTPDMPYFLTNVEQRIPRITYLHIYECEKFSIGIFCLPPSGVIPLHNHPGMTVFSKLLFGTMHIKSYDWVVDLPANSSTTFKPSESLATETQLAKVKVDADFTAPCNPSILYPADGGNLHCFTAVTACAVLDVLGPPYSDPDGRHCTYYLNHPFSTFSVDGISIPEEEKKGYEWLQERVLPDDVEVVGHLYSGPKIMET